jgi:hypothetical protein
MPALPEPIFAIWRNPREAVEFGLTWALLGTGVWFFGDGCTGLGGQVRAGMSVYAYVAAILLLTLGWTGLSARELRGLVVFLVASLFGVGLVGSVTVSPEWLERAPWLSRLVQPYTMLVAVALGWWLLECMLIALARGFRRWSSLGKV